MTPTTPDFQAMAREVLADFWAQVPAFNDALPSHALRGVIAAALSDAYDAGRQSGVEDGIERLTVVGPAHTYASENADLYRGFDNGIAAAIKVLRALGREGS